MNLLALDIGSAAVKAAVFTDRKPLTPIVRRPFPTCFKGTRVQVAPAAIIKSLISAIADLGPIARQVDFIAPTNMAPSWLAMDKTGKPLTPIITHQDRRSVAVAQELESTVGKDRLLHLSGNRPFPGGISSTTFAWHLRHERTLMKKADLVGHLNTYLHRLMTGARVTDPSNASFMGLYSTLDLSDWHDELIAAVGATRHVLPQILESNQIAGCLTDSAASRFGLTAGTPMLTGCMDGSAAMVLWGGKVGQLMDVCGSTDVLALCTDRPKPHERVLTRALGIGRRWMSVCTLAASGSAFAWAKDHLLPDLTMPDYWRLVSRLSSRPPQSTVHFEPYLAGDRMSIEQRQGAFTGITLSTTRQHLLSAIIESLARASAARLPLLQQTRTRIFRTVMVSGGMQSGLDKILRRDWPGRWTFRHEPEATLRGLSTLTPCQSPNAVALPWPASSPPAS